MSSIYNDYYALTDEGGEIADRISATVRQILKDYPEVPIYEIESACVSAITADCAEAKLIHAIKKRKKERNP